MQGEALLHLNMLNTSVAYRWAGKFRVWKDCQMLLNYDWPISLLPWIILLWWSYPVKVSVLQLSGVLHCPWNQNFPWHRTWLFKQWVSSLQELCQLQRKCLFTGCSHTPQEKNSTMLGWYELWTAKIWLFSKDSCEHICFVRWLLCS